MLFGAHSSLYKCALHPREMFLTYIDSLSTPLRTDIGSSDILLACYIHTYMCAIHTFLPLLFHSSMQVHFVFSLFVVLFFFLFLATFDIPKVSFFLLFRGMQMTRAYNVLFATEFRCVYFKGMCIRKIARWWVWLILFQCRQPQEQTVDPWILGEKDYLARKPVQDQNWKSPKGLGQVSGVSVDPHGRPVIFHRGDHVFDYE